MNTNCLAGGVQMMGGGLRSSGGVVMGTRGQVPITGLGSATPGVPGTTRYPGPGPIQRPPASQQVPIPSGTPAGGHRGPRSQTQGQQPSQNQSQRSSNPSSAQQAKFRAEALSTTQAFFSRDSE